MASIFGLGKGGLRYALNKEQFTGNYWIDGKSIYRYMVNNVTVNKNGTAKFDYPVSTIDEIVKIESMFILNGQRFFGNTNFFNVFDLPDTREINCQNNSSNYQASNGWIMIYYTKTTETGA